MTISKSLRASIRRALGSGVVARARMGVGGSHSTVTSTPLHGLEPISAGDGPTIAGAPDLHLYAHVAYCEHLCQFCAYSRMLGGAVLDTRRYVEALLLEMEMRQVQTAGARVLSAYIGGGTPTILNPVLLEALLSGVNRFAGGDIEHFCVETSPATLAADDAREKLAIMTRAGVNRISMGVQSFDNDLLRDSRGHDRRTVLRAVERALSLGLTVNIDMMQDLPHQSDQSLLNDLAFVAQLQPDQVTWYVLRPEHGAPWHKRMARGALEGMVDDETSAQRRIFINQEMRKLGYAQQPGGRFLRDHNAIDVFKAARSESRPHLLGFGVSAYSHGWNWIFRNVAGNHIKAAIAQYIGRIEAGGDAITEGAPLTHAEHHASELVKASRTYIAPAHIAYISSHDATLFKVVESLQALDLYTPDRRGGLHLTEIGAAFEEELASLFYSPAMRTRLAQAGQYWPAALAPRTAAMLGLTAQILEGTDEGHTKETSHVIEQAA